MRQLALGQQRQLALESSPAGAAVSHCLGGEAGLGPLLLLLPLSVGAMDALAALRAEQAARFRAAKAADAPPPRSGGVEGGSADGGAQGAQGGGSRRKKAPAKRPTSASAVCQAGARVATLHGGRMAKTKLAAKARGVVTLHDKPAPQKRRAAANEAPGAKAAKRTRVTFKDAAALAAELYGGGAQAEGAGGASAISQMINQQGEAANRIGAVAAGKHDLEALPRREGAKCAQLRARFPGLRKLLEERVQLLSPEEIAAVVRAVRERGSTRSRGGGATTRLLSAETVAARSPALFWSCVHAAGSVEAAVDRASHEEGAGGE